MKTKKLGQKEWCLPDRPDKPAALHSSAKFFLNNIDNHSHSQKYFLKAKEKKPRLILDNYIIDSLYSWSSVNKTNLENRNNFIID